jgi:hypothetical protein
LTVYDIAGLTRGASTGAGLGNAFLSHIRAVDAVFQVVRCFDDAEIIHVEGDVDPIRDLDIIAEELRLKDIEFVEKELAGLVKETRRGGQSLEMKKLKEEQATVEKILAMLKDGKDVRKGDWAPKEVRTQQLSPPFLSKDDKERLLYNPSSLKHIVRALVTPERHEKTSISDYHQPHLALHTPMLRAYAYNLLGRDHQPSIPPFRQARRLPGQPQREGLRPPEEQASAQDCPMGQGERYRRPNHSHLRRIRGAPGRHV